MSGISQDNQKAPGYGAFFIVSCLLVALLLFDVGPVGAAFATSPATEDCPVDRIDEFVKVRQVFDGDTILLMDGRKVRLLGINSPELEHDDRPAEPLATGALHWSRP